MATTDVTVPTCPDCGGPRDERAKRCASCHFARIRKPPSLCVDCRTPIAASAARCKPCSSLARRGRRLRKDGYVQVLAPGHPLARRDGYVFEHRLVLYAAGVDIPPGYQVHHLNGRRSDNRKDNLAVVHPSEHGRLHSPHTAKRACANGHPFNDENTHIDRGGWRRCRACNRANQRRMRERDQAEKAAA